MDTRTLTFALAGAAAVASAGCFAHQADYPDPDRGHGKAGQQGPMTASYPVPAAAPKGNVHVMSLGGERLAPGPQGGSGLFLHVRVAAENNGDGAPWTLHAHEQTISFGGGTAMPTYALSSAGGPTLTVGPGARGTLDLYYALPPQSDPPVATLSWTLHRGEEVLAQRTDFQLRSGRDTAFVDYHPTYRPGVTVAMAPGWWWYDDWYWYGRFGWYGGWWHQPYGPYGYYPYYPRYRSYYPDSGRVWGGGSAGGGSFRGGAWRGSGGSAAPSAPPSSGGGGGSKSSWRNRR